MKISVIVLFLLRSILGIFGTHQCGYKSCHSIDPNKINVHLVPHSHDDVGWLKTIDQYYYGTNTSIQDAGVSYIIGSVVQALLADPDRRFVQVETAFLAKWWKNQGEKTRARVRELVRMGRLEFAGGAWSMNDECATNYHSVVDQFELGLRFLDDTFGQCARPRVAWQIDPFGHTSEMGATFARLGFDALMFARLDFRDVYRRMNNGQAEFLWRGRDAESDIFVSLLYRFYDPPATFCWDVLCRDEPIVDDESSPLFNAKRRVDEFQTYIVNQAKYYRTGNILVTMGGDFTYQAADMYYENIDRLIKSFRKYNNETFHLIYSTPSCYVAAVNQMAVYKNLTFPVKEKGDFVPYASGIHSYWSGYYTSRPNSKGFERQGNNLLQVMKQLATHGVVSSSISTNDTGKLTELKETMGVMQHHDAITGTEKQHVANDYVRLLTKAMKIAETNISNIIHSLLLKSEKTTLPDLRLSSCLLANVSVCVESTNSQSFVVAVYNPLSRRVSHYVHLPVSQNSYEVRDLNGFVVDHQVSTGALAVNELVFHAADVPPHGLAYFYVQRTSFPVAKAHSYRLAVDCNGKIDLGDVDSSLGARFDEASGRLESVVFQGRRYALRQEFLFYSSANGSNQNEFDRASGAYIFRPHRSLRWATRLASNIATPLKAYAGRLFEEAHQDLGDVRQIIRVYRRENYIEFDWLAGPLQYRDRLGVELVSRFSSEIRSNGTFYTDSNGRGMVERTRGARPDYEYTDEEPVAGNYYPVTSRISIRDKDELTVLNDRAQGGSSLRDGEIELMIHRRLMKDDNFGVGEVLNETEFGEGVRVRGRHRVIVGQAQDPQLVQTQRHVQQQLLLSPWVFVGNSEKWNLSSLAALLKNQFAGLTRDLPPNVHIMTLEALPQKGQDSLLLRLEHVFEEGEHPLLSQPATVDLKGLFTLFDVISLEEMTLGANQQQDENVKLVWPVEKRYERSPPPQPVVNLSVILRPSQIRTFVITIIPK